MRSLTILAALPAIASAALQNQLNVPDSAFTSWFLPSPESGPCDVSTGPDNKIYVQEFFTNKIARFDQNTGTFKEFPIPFNLAEVGIGNLPLPGYAKFELLSCAIRTGYDGKSGLQ